MKNSDLSLAISSDGKDITSRDCIQYLLKKDKSRLANFIYDRLYGRYLKPFDYRSVDYQKYYKNGFALMASCCLLIETFISFTTKQYRNTKYKSRECFGYFFSKFPAFSSLTSGTIRSDGTLAKKNEVSTPNDFYENVRCGILHNGETRNGWKITRKISAPLFNPNTKTINAYKFSERLKKELYNYKVVLIKSDFDKDQIWINFKYRLNDLISIS